MQLREPGQADAGEIARVLNEHSRELFGEPDLTEGTVREWFELPDVWMRVAEADGSLAGYADVSEEGGRWSVDLRALDPDAARLLLAGAVEHVGAGALLRGYAPEADLVAAGAYEAAGWRIIRHAFRMRIALDGEPLEPRFPEGIEVRPMRTGEEERVHAAHMDAFADHWEFHEQSYEQWRRWHRDREIFDPTLWFLALAEDELVGLALCGPHLSGEPGFGWVDVLGVRPPWRRRGLGEALLRHAFRELQLRGFDRVGLGVDAENPTGAVALYERAGMRTVRVNHTWELRT